MERIERKLDDNPNTSSRTAYEESYGDADQGGWAPREREDDVSERSRYSSQRDRQEDRSGFTRGFQGKDEVAEEHTWPSRHARSDEKLADETTREREYPGGWIYDLDIAS